MKILIIGSGGREHAIAWKVAQNKTVETIYCAPGNGGTANEDKCINISITDKEELADFAEKKAIDLTIVGPEEPLINGIVDTFKKRDLLIFGPSMEGAKLEGSKIFSKNFMKKYGVKTAEYEYFNDIESARDYVTSCKYPMVIKADGLAAGKGVVICQNKEEAITVLNEFMIEDIFKGAGKRILIEEYLEGVEASILSITDGKTIIPFVSAKDHKQIFDGNNGPNTGGMGAIAPNTYCTPEVLKAFNEEIMEPTIRGIREENLDFIGIVFFGIMITAQGVYLLEYNVRLGDPETEAVLPLMESDFVELILVALKGELKNYNISWKNEVSCCVIAASGGYPGKYKKGIPIDIEAGEYGKVFIAGAKNVENKLITDGGRVLCATSIGSDLDSAVEAAYKNMSRIYFDGIYYRKDIGKI